MGRNRFFVYDTYRVDTEIFFHVITSNFWDFKNLLWDARWSGLMKLFQFNIITSA